MIDKAWAFYKANAARSTAAEERAMADSGTHETNPPEATIAINLGKLQQLFNSFDPSPFHDRDLDHDAEEYIVGWAEEIALHRPLKLVIHLPQDQWTGADQTVLEHAIHKFCLPATAEPTPTSSPSHSLIRSAMIRPVTSLPLPAAKDTIMVIGRVG